MNAMGLPTFLCSCSFHRILCTVCVCVCVPYRLISFLFGIVESYPDRNYIIRYHEATFNFNTARMQCNGIAKVMLFIFKSSNVIVMKTSANFVLCYNCVVILFKGKSIFEHQHKIYLSDVKCTKMHLWLWALFGMQPPITIVIGEKTEKNIVVRSRIELIGAAIFTLLKGKRIKNVLCRTRSYKSIWS